MTQTLANGLVQGALYAIVALGYTMVYGILLMINFAHGEVLMLGAYTGVVTLVGLTATGAADSLGILPCLGIAVFAAMVVAGAHGVILERVAYRPLRRAHQLAPLISAIGMSIFLQNYVMLAKGATPRYVPTNSPAYQEAFVDTRIEVLGATLSALDVFILALCVALMAALYVFVQRTRLGRAMRATSQDRVMAGLVGVNVDRVISLTFLIGSVLAAVAGVLLALKTSREAKYDMGFMAGMKAFTAAVLGGIGNVPGAMLGGLVLGLAEEAGIAYLGSQYKEAYALIILLLVLVVRPRGLMGERVTERV